MKKQISKSQYVLIDMLIMALILCGLEWAIKTALNAFPRELYTISVVLPVTLIAMMRHGAPGILISTAGGFAYCAINGAEWDIFLIYMLGNSLVAVNLLMHARLGKERIRLSTGLTILYVVSGYLLMNLGRSIFALVFGYSPLFETMVRFFATDALSGAISIVIVLIARKQDGVFEDQTHYLERLALEREQGNGNET